MCIGVGRRLADRLFGGLIDAKCDYDNIPTVVFSHPPIGAIGLTQDEAEAKYSEENVKVYTSRFVNMHYGIVNEPIDPSNTASGFHPKPMTAMKLVCAGPDEKIVGLHVIGLGADEMLQGFGVAMKVNTFLD